MIALLPAATAVMAVIRGHLSARASRSGFLTGVGAIAALVFASIQGGGIGQLQLADLLLFGAVIAAAVGYAEGGLIAARAGVVADGVVGAGATPRP